ncbi:CDP-2,3-bis-(O-geranylgeranyl)-sn-glycerol synthase [Candidatus Dojkabacteria bacterium]|nr:CDP-2,3-bis-(O-geranylgeranyl)-sn-glycerol synthase [Candidatus Dojkabacteria bacterium]
MILLESLFFILPTYVANGCASLSTSIPILKNWSTPIDFGHEWKGKRILGDGKTFRGILFGTFCGILVGILEFFIAKHIDFQHLGQFKDATLVFFLKLSFLLGFGGLVGDLVKSLIKRRLGIKRGRPWPPFDQTDFLIGGLLFSSLLYFPGWTMTFILFIMTPVVHLFSNITAYLLKLKDVWW